MQQRPQSSRSACGEITASSTKQGMDTQNLLFQFFFALKKILVHEIIR
jgi:hypothetical protein